MQKEDDSTFLAEEFLNIKNGTIEQSREINIRSGLDPN